MIVARPRRTGRQPYRLGRHICQHQGPHPPPTVCHVRFGDGFSLSIHPPGQAGTQVHHRAAPQLQRLLASLRPCTILINRPAAPFRRPPTSRSPAFPWGERPNRPHRKRIPRPNRARGSRNPRKKRNLFRTLVKAVVILGLAGGVAGTAAGVACISGPATTCRASAKSRTIAPLW